MAFDWKTFQQGGLGPALGTMDTFLQNQLQSQLYRQTHEQRMAELEKQHELSTKEMEAEYAQRERLARINADIDRSLALDNDELQTARLFLTNWLEQGQERDKHTNQMELARFQADAGLKRANVYKEIAEINHRVKASEQYDPALPGELNQNVFSSLLEDYQFLGQQIAESEALVQSIQTNPLYQKSMSGEVDQFDTQQMPWFKEMNDQLVATQKNLRDYRRQLMLVKNEVIKFAFDAKIPNPLDDSAAMQAMVSMGIPAPVGGKPTKSTLSLSEHMRALEELVLDGRDLPDDYTLAKAGLDVAWTKNNWPQYRDFFRANQTAVVTKFLAESTFGEPTQFIKNLSKIAASIFSK